MLRTRVTASQLFGSTHGQLSELNNELFLQNVTIFMWESHNLLSNSHKCVFWGHSDLWPLSSNQLIFVAVDMKTFPRGVSGTDDTFILTEVTIWFLISENFSFLHHNFHFNWNQVSPDDVTFVPPHHLTAFSHSLLYKWRFSNRKHLKS